MSLSSLKRSASDAQLENPQRPRKAARKSMSKSESKRRRERRERKAAEQGVASMWKDALSAVGGAAYATFVKAINPLWRILNYRDVDKLVLPTYHLIEYKPSSLPTLPPQESRPKESAVLKPPPRKTNNAPTNVLASSSKSAASLYPTPQSSQASSSISSASSANASSSGGLESASTQTSVPSTPPSAQSTSDAPRAELIRQLIGRRNLDRVLENGVFKGYRRKPHIFERQHREAVKEHQQRMLYDYKRRLGYESDFETFKKYVDYQRRVEAIHRIEQAPCPASSETPSSIVPEDENIFFRRAVEKAWKSLHSPQPPKPLSSALDGLTLRTRSRNELIKSRLHPKRKPIPERLPSDAEKEVSALLKKRGVVSKAGREQVNDTDLARLLPGQWLNDEIINFYGQLIVDRTAEAEAGKENKEGKLWNVHYFSTFFWSKLQSGYEKGRLAKWTKKVDIFSKDIVIMAINHGNAHWTSAAIDFRRKRILSFDSMGITRPEVQRVLRAYLNEEHKNKKKKPFDFTGWEDYRSETYPQQENGYDCGVFTCQTLEYLSRGEEDFNFTQKNMPYLRQRMLWEIGRAKLGDPL